ncbi:MAG TPA: LLM class flavin-dependent oxidoreductase [Chloroflexia bacterium]|nr:LLM class flavin-dependent oxidoreductase [Chloroflexia bacterium]
MQFAFNLPNFGPYHDPRLVAGLAADAEAAGWDGFFLWDHIQWPYIDEVGDPWIILALIAAGTSRIKLGAVVTPLPRRHPWKLARETATLDHLSAGRLIVGVGIGGAPERGLWEEREFEAFGQYDDAPTRAAKLDEGLAVLAGLWSGQPFSFSGTHYQVKDTQFLPPTVQQPRPRVWVAGTWPRKAPVRRAARWDGYVPIKEHLAAITPEDVQAMAAYMAEHRTDPAPFDLVVGGPTTGTDPAADQASVLPFVEAGATWWSEGRLPWETSVDEVRTRIRLGPPRL